MSISDDNAKRQHVVATWSIASNKERKFALVDAFIASFALGIGVGVIYFFSRVKAPAPPLIALFGLLGMVVGEKLPPLIQTLISLKR